jgi:hypothetical protein
MSHYRICAEGSKREKVMGDQKILHSEELHNMYHSLNTIEMIKLKGVMWAGYILYKTEER